MKSIAPDKREVGKILRGDMGSTFSRAVCVDYFGCSGIILVM
jgi:hypothetical protein